MLTKEQASAAADVLIETNKSLPPKPKKTPYEFYKQRAVGGIIGLLVAVILNSIFDNKFSYALIFIVSGMLIGERIGNYLKTKKKGA